MLPGEKYVTASLVIPMIKGLFLQLTDIETKLKADDSKIFLGDIRRYMTEKLNLYEDRTVSRVATAIDPRFKKTGFKSDSNYKEGMKIITQELVKMSPACTTAAPIMPMTTKKTALDYIDNKSEPRTATVNNTVTIDNFEKDKNLEKNETSDATLCYLKARHPELYRVALIYFCTPGSSVPCERIFSSTGQIVSARRNCLSAENINILTFIHHNIHLIEF